MRCSGPAALVLTRQDIAVLDRTVFAPADGARRGAYVLRDPKDGAPEVILVGTGSEVGLAIEAADRLAAEGRRARVVSMPSWELFEAQDAAYKDSVVPSSVHARVVVEAGIRQGWDRYIGSDGGFVTLEGFGASAPYQTLYRELGITTEAVVAEAKRLLARR
jgi:transketolase